jgi:hypothetical protein
MIVDMLRASSPDPRPTVLTAGEATHVFNVPARLTPRLRPTVLRRGREVALNALTIPYRRDLPSPPFPFR